MFKLVIIRHGESVWNQENIFTGWIDTPLSEKGIEQAQKAGKLLKEKGFSFDLAYTSVLERAYETLNYILKEMKLKIPVEKSWRLNERHYGALQGLNKSETREKYGNEQVEEWRRSYLTRPPARLEEKELAYKEVKEGLSPFTESLKDTELRLLPYWNKIIIPKIKEGNKIIIAAHGNSIRALIKNIEGISGDEIAKLEIPIGIPLIYELDENLKVIKKYSLI
jgi:2,3-bisphosphoglycerate-dependent phosphoglycerate mutase